MASTPQNERTRKAWEIAQNPKGYKVCEGCDSIVVEASVTCPNCHGYRFDDNPSRVSDQALELGSREQRSVTAEDLMS